MATRIEELLDSYYEDSIELKDGMFLFFKRNFDHRGTNRSAIDVSIEDVTNKVIIHISTYFDGKWIFATPTHENIFWEYVKPNRTQVKTIIDRMHIAPPNKEIFAYQLKIKHFTDSTTAQLGKLLEIFKGK